MAGRLKLGEILLRAGVITKEQLNSALEDQKHYGGRLATILLDRRMITEKIYFQALSSQLKIPAVDFSRSSIPEAICRLVPRDMAEKHVAFPVGTRRSPGGSVLLLAMSDPTNVQAQDEIRFLTGFKVEPLLGLENTIRVVIREFWYEQEGKGSYSYKPDTDLAAGAVEKAEAGMEIDRGEEHRPAREAAPAAGPAPAPAGRMTVERERGQDAPQLTRELRTLLKLLVRKGLITQQEYLDEFKEN
jgi:type IV pilus assembly protein PilB